MKFDIMLNEERQYYTEKEVRELEKIGFTFELETEFKRGLFDENCSENASCYQITNETQCIIEIETLEELATIVSKFGVLTLYSYQPFLDIICMDLDLDL